MEKLTNDKDFVIVKKTLKNYGNDRKLWYWDYQGAIFELFFNHKTGYLVMREGDNRKWLIKHQHAELITGKEFIK